MSNLKLVTTETFNNLQCNFYRNMNDDILLTRDQIGQALEYSDPIKAIQKIHLKHQDRLEPLCMRIKGSTQIGGDLSKSEEQERVYYTERGIMEICRWSRQKNANIFMDWTWDIIMKYRHNELTTTPNIQPLVDAITTLTQTVDTMQQDISSLKQQSAQNKQNNIPIKKYSRWKTNTFNKLTRLMEYVNAHSSQKLTLPNIIHITLDELQDCYDIEISDYVDVYMSEYGLESTPYSIDVIEHYKDIRKLYSSVLDNRLEQFGLIAETTLKKNIFDVLADNLPTT